VRLQDTLREKTGELRDKVSGVLRDEQ